MLAFGGEVGCEILLEDRRIRSEDFVEEGRDHHAFKRVRLLSAQAIERFLPYLRGPNGSVAYNT